MDSSVRVAPLTALLFHVSPSHKEPCSATCGHSVVPYTWRAHFLDRVMTPSGPDRRAFFTAPMNTSVVVAAVAAVVVVAVVAAGPHREDAPEHQCGRPLPVEHHHLALNMLCQHIYMWMYGVPAADLYL